MFLRFTILGFIPLRGGKGVYEATGEIVEIIDATVA
jgi:hypothetical protein